MSPTRLSTVLLAAILIGSCDDAPLPQTAEETVLYAADKLARDRDPGVLWDLLPTSYRARITGWTRQLAAELPAASYDKFFRVLHKAGIVIKKKQDFLLAFGPVRMGMQLMGDDTEDEVIAALTAIGDVNILLADSEISTLRRLRDLDIAAFLHGTGRRLWRHGSRAMKLTGQDPDIALRQLRCKTVTATPDQAQLEIEVSGQSVVVDFARVEGRWIPRQLAERWPDVEQAVTRALAELKQPKVREALRRFEKQLDALLDDLTKLEAIDSRGKFATAVQNMALKYGDMLSALFRNG